MGKLKQDFIKTINKMHYLIDEAGYTEDIQIVSSIYDSIYLHVKCDATIIKWVNCYCRWLH